MKHFLWQVLAGHIAVASRLVERHCGHDKSCQRCGAEVESINHMLFECPPAVQCWALSTVPSNPGLFPCNSLFNKIDYLLWRAKEQGAQAQQIEVFPWIAWYIWKARNAKVFQGKDTSPQDTVDLAKAESYFWFAAQVIAEAIDDPPELRSEERSAMTTQPWTCHIDASWTSKDTTAGLGFALSRDEMLVLQGIKGIRAINSALQAEFAGLLWAMEVLVQRSILEVNFLSDCQQLAHLIAKEDDWPALASEMDDFKFYKAQFKAFSISYIPRSQNIRADNLSKGARARGTTFSFVTTETEALLALEANFFAFG